MKASQIKLIFIGMIAAIFLTVNVQAQTKAAAAKNNTEKSAAKEKQDKKAAKKAKKAKKKAAKKAAKEKAVTPAKR
jgi:hypothetical protein